MTFEAREWRAVAIGYLVTTILLIWLGSLSWIVPVIGTGAALACHSLWRT